MTIKDTIKKLWRKKDKRLGRMSISRIAREAVKVVPVDLIAIEDQLHLRHQAEIAKLARPPANVLP